MNIIAAAATDGDAPGNTAAAIVILALTLLVIVLALGFSLIYHHRLLRSVDRAVAKGVVKSVTNVDVGGGAEVSRDSGITIAGPAEVTAGEAVTYRVEGGTSDLTWTIEGGGAQPATGAGGEFTTTFQTPGTATIGVDFTGVTGQKAVTVKAPPAAAPAASGIVLPFAIRNWGRLVVVLLGIGIVAALMTLDVISAEGGIGLLGALLGVGAASANQDPTAQAQGGAAENAE
jgi:hypothetical protein